MKTGGEHVAVWANMALVGLVLLFAIYEGICVLMWEEAAGFHKLVALLALVAAIWLLVRRDTWLPFLGRAVLPGSLLPRSQTPEGANLEVELPFVGVADGTRIVYWGAQEAKGVIENPFAAYGSYPNAGVTVVRNGKAKMALFCPARYHVPGRIQALRRHIHLRVVSSEGMLGPVRTVFVEC